MNQTKYIYHKNYKDENGVKISPPKELISLTDKKLTELKDLDNFWVQTHFFDKLDKYKNEKHINLEQYNFLKNKNNILEAIKMRNKRLVFEKRYEYELEDIPMIEKRKYAIKEFYLKSCIDFRLDKQHSVWIVILFKENQIATIKTLYIKIWTPEEDENILSKYSNPKHFPSSIIKNIL